MTLRTLCIPSLAAAALAAISCGPAPVAVAPPTPEITIPAPTVSATATAAETAPEPPPRPVIVDKTIVGGKSLAGVKLGASRAEVLRLLGSPEEVNTYDKGVTQYLSYQSKGVSFLLKRGIVDAGFAYSGRRGGYETGEFVRFDGKTDLGVDMDTSYEDVIRIYGTPSDTGELSEAPVPSYWILYSAQGIGFDFTKSSNQMVTIRISSPE